MNGRTQHEIGRHLSTRSQVLRAALGGGAVAAGAGALGARTFTSASASGPSSEQDARILNVLLLLEQVQDAFYREALSRAKLGGELRDFARAVGEQERAHVAFLSRRLGSRARRPPRSDFGDALSSPERFRSAAVDLEEAVIAAYIGQGANLTRAATTAVVTLVSVEARQAAWIRDLAGENPAPRAADPARTPGAVVDELRSKGFIE
jgi:hypothetical protein